MKYVEKERKKNKLNVHSECGTLNALINKCEKEANEDVCMAYLRERIRFRAILSS